MPADLLEVATRLGLERHHRRWGPCPACRADRTSDGRPPLRIANGRWWCNACSETGDAVTLAAWAMLGRGVRKGDSELRRVFDWVDGRAEPERDVRVPRPAPERPPEPPPYDELVRALRACTPAASDPAVADYLRSRGITPELAPAGALPTTWDARWWPRAWSATWRLVVPAFDGQGRLRTLHARAIGDARPKTRWPLDCDATGVLFADALGRQLLRGQMAAERLIICEGLPDYLATSAEAAGTAAVISVESGSASALAALRARIDPHIRVYVATHADLAGDGYAASIAAALAPHPCRRVPLHLLQRRAA